MSQYQITPEVSRPIAVFRPALAIPLLLSLAMVIACGSGNGRSPEETAVISSDLYVPNGVTLWNNNNLGASATIPVCFAVRPQLDDTQNPPVTYCPNETDSTRDCAGQVNDSQRGAGYNDTYSSMVPFLRFIVAYGAEDSWMRSGNIALYNWGDCPIDPATNMHKFSQLPGTIVIRMQQEFDPPPNRACLGDIDCSPTPNAVCNLNVQAPNFPTCVAGAVDYTTMLGKSNTVPTIIQYNWPELIRQDRFNVVHEFGHALGFGHEWNRPDYPLACASDKGHTPGTYLTSFADTQSEGTTTRSPRATSWARRPPMAASTRDRLSATRACALVSRVPTQPTERRRSRSPAWVSGTTSSSSQPTPKSTCGPQPITSA
jgi:hypothetical protein